ncbi:MAG: hypothetical protein ACK42D_01920 [Candidatus Paceibacteria bacterium]
MNTDTATTPSNVKKWTVAFGIAFGALPFIMLYVYGFLGTISTPVSWTVITAGVAGVLLASSIGAGSVSYYIGWPNLRAGYQKQIGELAFLLCLIYCFQLLWVFPDTYYYGFWENLWTADILLGLSAMSIFGVMILANSPIGKRFLDWEQIKFILGFGFVGYALLVFRAIALEGHIWAEWFVTFDGLPTTRFVLSLLAFLVLLLRASIIVHRKIRPRING